MIDIVVASSLGNKIKFAFIPLSKSFWFKSFGIFPNSAKIFNSLAPVVKVFSGFLEIVAGIGLLIPTVSHIAAWGLVLLFIAVYPANINMAVNHIQIANIPDSNWFQAIRLPFQFVLIAWAWWLTRPDDNRFSTSN